MLFLFLAIVAVLELVRQVPLFAAFRDMAACQAHVLRLVRRRGVSEWGKERAMRILAGRLFARSLRAGGLLVIVAAPLLLVLGLAALDPRLIGLRLDDWAHRLWLAPLSLGYAALRWQIGLRVRTR